MFTYLGISLSLASHCNFCTVQVEPNAHRIEEHRRKYERLHKEREERKIERERQRRRAEAQVTFFFNVQLLTNLSRYSFATKLKIFLCILLKAAYEKAKKQEQSSSSKPGGMPGGFPGGMPGGFPGGMPGGMPGGFPGGMPGGFPGGMPGGMPGGVPGNVDFSKILNVSFMGLARFLPQYVPYDFCLFDSFNIFLTSIIDAFQLSSEQYM